MESLRKLEELQTTIMLMQSHGIITSSSDHHSARFLANLVLFLLQPYGELDLAKKTALLSEYIPKISAGFLEKASVCLSEKGFPQQILVKDSQKNSEDKSTSDLLPTNFEEIATIGLDAMQRANSTIEDFLDSLNEKIVQAPSNRVKSSEEVYEMVTPRTLEENLRLIAKFTNVFVSDPFRSLVGLLGYHGLLTERIKEEFKHGEEYWALERMLCCALVNRKEISVEDVIKAIHLKSFDYRVLNLLLYQLRGEQVDELHMDFLSISEFLVEVADDLFDYEDDVLDNNFNVLRMFVRIYGASAPTMLAKYITEAEEKYNMLLKTLDPQLSLNYQRRCEEATREGGNMSKHPLGTWSIPPLITDEELYRSNLLNPK
ncbi:hypothetical protein L484_022153 [Morus notabilis]|uniref:Uncharacterized protein n=1 Tax=Morus notabilis TaxID=981085 RepID=W9QDS1_9ROSA|nr:hypothetical protein L484_022153 [Morus notabilis]